MLIFRNIYTDDNLTPAQKNYQSASITDWLDNNGKSSRSINHLITIDHRTASKSILAEKGYTPSTVNANKPEEYVDIFRSKKYIYKTIPNEFFLDRRLSHAEKAYLIAMDFAWLKNDNQQILPVCHLETVTKYFNFVRINTLKKYIKKLEEKGYIKYTSNRNGITNVSIDYTGNYKSIPEEFKPAEEEINEIVNPTIEKQTVTNEIIANLQKQIDEQQKQIDELKELVISLQNKLVETQTELKEHKLNNDKLSFDTDEIYDILTDTDNDTENNQTEEVELADNQTEEKNTVTFSIVDSFSNTKIDDEELEENEDCPLELLESLEKQQTESLENNQIKEVELSKDSLFAIMNPELLNDLKSDLKNEGLADLQHRSSSWNDLKGAEELQKNIAERKNDKEALADYIVDYINSNKDIRNTVNCLDEVYYKIFFTLAKEKVYKIVNSYWKRNIPTMDLSLDFETKEAA